MNEEEENVSPETPSVKIAADLREWQLPPRAFTEDEVLGINPLFDKAGQWVGPPLASNDDAFFANKARWEAMRNDMAECLHVSRSSRHPRAHPYGKGGGTPNACPECITDADMMVEFAHSDRYAPAPKETPS